MIRPALVSLALLTLLTGVAYPLAVTAVAQLAFPKQANGSLIVKNGKVVGSSLIGQQFDDPKYVWGRPSACKYDGASSSGSNLGPTNPALADNMKARADSLRDPDVAGPIPVDLLTSSGSGLDPHISPAGAEYQVHRVARARGIDEARVRDVVQRNTEGFPGEPRVNVLAVNLALDDLR